MGNYSKLIGGIVGGIVAIGMAYLASRGFGTCAPAADASGSEVCTVWGFSSTQITAAVMLIVTNVFVFAFPKNQP